MCHIFDTHTVNICSAVCILDESLHYVQIRISIVHVQNMWQNERTSLFECEWSAKNFDNCIRQISFLIALFEILKCFIHIYRSNERCSQRALHSTAMCCKWQCFHTLSFSYHLECVYKFVFNWILNQRTIKNILDDDAAITTSPSFPQALTWLDWKMSKTHTFTHTAHSNRQKIKWYYVSNMKISRCHLMEVTQANTKWLIANTYCNQNLVNCWKLTIIHETQSGSCSFESEGCLSYAIAKVGYDFHSHWPWTEFSTKLQPWICCSTKDAIKCVTDLCFLVRKSHHRNCRMLKCGFL